MAKLKPTYLVCIVVLCSIKAVLSNILDLNNPTKFNFKIIQYTKENVNKTIIYSTNESPITQINVGSILLFKPLHGEKIKSVTIMRFKNTNEVLLVLEIENAIAGPQKYYSRRKGPFKPIDERTFLLKFESLSNKPKYDPSKIVTPGVDPKVQKSFERKLRKRFRDGFFKEKEITPQDVTNIANEPPIDILTESFSDEEKGDESWTKSEESTDSSPHKSSTEEKEYKPDISTHPIEQEQPAPTDDGWDLNSIHFEISDTEEPTEEQKKQQRKDLMEKLKNKIQHRMEEKSKITQPQTDELLADVVQVEVESDDDEENDTEKHSEPQTQIAYTKTVIPTSSTMTQTDTHETEDTETQTLTPTSSTDTQTDTHETEDTESQTVIPTSSTDTQTDTQQSQDIETQTDIYEAEESETQTEMLKGSVKTQTAHIPSRDIKTQTKASTRTVKTQTIESFTGTTLTTQKIEEQVKRKRGRPRKRKAEEEGEGGPRKRGRPRKHKISTERDDTGGEPTQPQTDVLLADVVQVEVESDDDEENDTEKQSEPQTQPLVDENVQVQAKQQQDGSLKAVGPSPEKRPFSFDLYYEDPNAEHKIVKRPKRVRTEPPESGQQPETTEAVLSSGAGAPPPPPPGDGSEPPDGPGGGTPPEEDQEGIVLVEVAIKRIVSLEDPGSNKRVIVDYEINDGIPTLIVKAKPHKTVTHVVEQGVIICEADKGSKLLSFSAFSYYNHYTLIEIIFQTATNSYIKYFRKHGGDWVEVDITHFEAYYQELRGNVVITNEIMVDISLPLDPFTIFSKFTEKNGLIQTVLMPMPGFFIKQVNYGTSLVWSSQFRRCLAITLTSRIGDIPRLLMLEISGPNDGVTEEMHFHRLGNNFTLISRKLYDSVVHEDPHYHGSGSPSGSENLQEMDHSDHTIPSGDSFSSESTPDQQIQPQQLVPQTIHFEMPSDEADDQEPLDLSQYFKKPEPEPQTEHETTKHTPTEDILSSKEEEFEDEQPLDLSVKAQSESAQPSDLLDPETIQVELESEEEEEDEDEDEEEEHEEEHYDDNDEDFGGGEGGGGGGAGAGGAVGLIPLQVINNENYVGGIHKGVPYRTYSPPQGKMFDAISSGSKIIWKAVEGCGTDNVRLFFVTGLPRLGFFRQINLKENDIRYIFIVESQGGIWKMVEELNFHQAFYELTETLSPSTTSQESSQSSPDTQSQEFPQ